MRKHVMGLAAAVVVAVSATPAAAGCGGCGPSYGYSTYNYAGYGGGYSSGCGALVSSCGASYGYASYLPQQPVVYSAQPQYYYVNQGPTYTGPGMYAPVASYQQRAVGGWYGYSTGYGYNGGPYANASHHYYHGAPAWSGPAVYSYRRAYRPAVRYGYSKRWAAPRQSYAPRSHRAYAPRVHYAPRYAAPRYSVAPHQHGHSHQRVLRRYN